MRGGELPVGECCTPCSCTALLRSKVVLLVLRSYLEHLEVAGCSLTCTWFTCLDMEMDMDKVAKA